MIQIPNGLLIVIEGIDGAGKTTQASLIAQFLGQFGYPCVMSKEPTGRKWGRALKDSAATGRLSPEDELELFIKDRQDHVENVVEPALKEGLVVILDRYFYSTAAYQGPRGISVEDILETNQEFAPIPDLLLILDLSAEQGLQRIRLRGDTPNTFEGAEDLNKARQVFLDLKGDNLQIIDATRPIAEVSENVRNAVIKAAKAKEGKIARFLSSGLTCDDEFLAE